MPCNSKCLGLDKVTVTVGQSLLSWRIVDGHLEIRLGDFAEWEGNGGGWTRNDIAPLNSSWSIFNDGVDIYEH